MRCGSDPTLNDSACKMFSRGGASKGGWSAKNVCVLRRATCMSCFSHLESWQLYIIIMVLACIHSYNNYYRCLSINNLCIIIMVIIMSQLLHAVS